jgi:hypothetical protein
MTTMLTRLLRSNGRGRAPPPPAEDGPTGMVEEEDALTTGGIIMAGNGEGGEEDGGGAAEEDSGGGGSAYHAFRSRQARGVLYKISSVDDLARARLTAYVQDGAMDADLRYVREVFGLVNTSGRKDFDQFWESPWVEEHVRDTTRKRKLDAQQRAVAVRSYIRASSSNTAVGGGEPENIDKYLETVDRLTEWEDRHGAKDLVKTVSRMVQSFERAAIAALQQWINDPVCASYRANVNSVIDPDQIRLPDGGGPASVTSVACTLRRADPVFHLFAAMVASQIIRAEAINGARNTSIYMCRQLDARCQESTMALVRTLHSVCAGVTHDTVGLPLMTINASMCVCRGVLVVLPGGTSATYVLDLADGITDLTGVRNIRVSHVVDATPPAERAKN